MAKKVQYTTNQPSSTTDYLAADNTWKPMSGGGGGGVTSVAVTVPSALSVSGSPITTTGTIAISGAGSSSQYIKGDGTLGTTPTSLPPSGTAGGDLTGTYPNPTVHRVHGIDFQNGTPSADEVWVYGGSPNKWQHQKLHSNQVTNDSTVTGTNVDNALDTLKTSIATKQDTITGGASSIVSSNLTNYRALVSDGGGKVAVAATTSNEIGYLSGVTSNIQTQLDSKVSSGGGSSFVLISLSATGIALSTTRYYYNGGAGGSAAESQLRTPMPSACTCSNLYARITGTQSATGSLVFTLFKNGSATALVLTIAAGSIAGTYSNTSNSVSFAAGDGYSVEVKNNATIVSAPISGMSFKLTI